MVFVVDIVLSIFVAVWVVVNVVVLVVVVVSAAVVVSVPYGILSAETFLSLSLEKISNYIEKKMKIFINFYLPLLLLLL